MINIFVVGVFRELVRLLGIPIIKHLNNKNEKHISEKEEKMKKGRSAKKST